MRDRNDTRNKPVLAGQVLWKFVKKFKIGHFVHTTAKQVILYCGKDENSSEIMCKNENCSCKLTMQTCDIVAAILVVTTQAPQYFDVSS